MQDSISMRGWWLNPQIPWHAIWNRLLAGKRRWIFDLFQPIEFFFFRLGVACSFSLVALFDSSFRRSYRHSQPVSTFSSSGQFEALFSLAAVGRSSPLRREGGSYFSSPKTKRYAVCYGCPRSLQNVLPKILALIQFKYYEAEKIYFSPCFETYWIDTLLHRSKFNVWFHRFFSLNIKT